jgi:hypothetical protein
MTRNILALLAVAYATFGCAGHNVYFGGSTAGLSSKTEPEAAALTLGFVLYLWFVYVVVTRV